MKRVIGLGAVIAVAGAAFLFWPRAPHTPEAPQPFEANRANDKLLLVSGWSPDELSAIVGEFAHLYRDQLPADFAFDVKSGGALQRVSFPRDMPPWMFLFLVNYVQYPKGHDLAGRKILVAGTTLLTPDFKLPEKDLYGKRAVFYVPDGDKEFNNVYARVTGALSYKVSFEPAQWTPAQEPRVPPGLTALAGPAPPP